MTVWRLAMWTVLVVAVAGVAGFRVSEWRHSAPPAAVKLAFVTGGPSPYWQMTVKGAEAAAKKHDVDLLIKTPADDESVQQQTEILSNLNLADLHGIAVSPLDAAGQTDLLNSISKTANVVTFDSDAPNSNRLAYIGTSNFSAGLTCARLLQEALPDGGKIVVLLANLTKDNVLDRKGGFEERIRQFGVDTGSTKEMPKFVVVDYLVDNGSADLCKKNIRDSLEKHPDLACFVGMNAMHGPLLLQTLKEAGKLGHIKLVTFDVEDETLEGIDAGHIFATIAQDPYQFGFEAVTMLAAIARGDETRVPVVGRGSLSVSAEPIYRYNLDDLRERLETRQIGPADRSAPK